MRAAMLLLAIAAAGCVTRKTRETEVGVLVCKVALGCENKGVQKVVYAPGSTHFFAPWIRDFYTFDIKLQNLEMVADKQRPLESHDDLEF